jgi:hypothetical protein
MDSSFVDMHGQILAFFFIFQLPLLGKTNIFFNFFWLMQTPLRLITISACIWSTFSDLLLVKAAGPCFLLAEKIFTFYATFLDH